MPQPCHQKGKETGAWYEIKCVQDIIRDKEANGEDASFERELLKSWKKHLGYKKATEGLPRKSSDHS